MKQKNKVKKSQTSIVEHLKSKKGFTLIEALIAIFIFSFAVTMLIGAFSSFFKSYVNSKKIQRDVENAQYAMNLMAKTLRTSYIPAVTNNFPLDSYDYSQDKCIRYIVAGSKIKYYSSSPATTGAPTTCTYASGSLLDLTPASIVGASVSATPTNPVGPVLGKVTVVLSVRDQSNTTSAIPIQMSVSLRQ